MFAADTTLSRSSKGTQCLLSSEKNPPCDRFSSKKLNINPAKCDAICLDRSKPVKIIKCLLNWITKHLTNTWEFI